jgi:ABC-type Mn2+/Zn2+ transport system permease subunit
MITQNKRLTGILITVALLLLIPLIAMQFTNEVDWSLRDFVIMGILLLATGLICEFVMRKVKTTGKRIAVIAVILLVFFLIWAELAVGIFGSPFAGT